MSINEIDFTQTPIYLFSEKKIIDCYRSICNKMPDISIYYALKANSEKEILSILKKEGSNFEVASIGEFNILKAIGVESQKIICGLPVKPVNWLKHMYSSGCLYYVFDTISELNKLIKYAPSSNKILRVNINDLLPDCIDFGMEIKDIEKNFSNNLGSINYVDGLSFHISNNIDIIDFNKVLYRIENLLELFSKEDFILNIGGGYRLEAGDEFFLNLNSQISDLKMKYNVIVIAEPGNAIINSSGKAYTTIVGTKKRKDYVDIFMDFGKPSGLKTSNKRIPTSIKVINKKKSNIKFKYRFIDITCMHKPHFSCFLEYPLEEGDILEFGGMGAYSSCLQNKFHLWKSPKIEILK